MKKALLLLVVLFAAVTANAQFDFCIGPKVGYQTMELSVDKAVIESQFNDSKTFGAFARITIKKFFIQPELTYYKSGEVFDLDLFKRRDVFIYGIVQGQETLFHRHQSSHRGHGFRHRRQTEQSGVRDRHVRVQGHIAVAFFERFTVVIHVISRAEDLVVVKVVFGDFVDIFYQSRFIQSILLYGACRFRCVLPLPEGDRTSAEEQGSSKQRCDDFFFLHGKVLMVLMGILY